MTRGEFADFVAATGYAAAEGCYTWTGSAFEFDRSLNWQKPGFLQTNRHPVACVNWEDARAFAVWLTVKTKKPYRLPSEAEWEYAARAGTRTSRYWGDDTHNNFACIYANVADLTDKERFTDRNTFDCKDLEQFTAPVGSFLPNGYGAYDMMGKFWEWVQDCWATNYSGAHVDNSGPIERFGCPARVRRGGSWGSPATDLRSADRYRIAPIDRLNTGGFRVARSLAP